MTEGAFFQDLALVMAVAGLVAALFSRMRWPKVLGYIGAGVLLNKYTWGWSLLADSQSINTIAQLGVVFLMFSMGLSFSAKDMKKPTRSAHVSSAGRSSSRCSSASRCAIPRRRFSRRS